MDKLNVFVLLALVTMAAFIAAAFKKRHELSKAMTLFLLGICFSSAVLFFPFYYVWDIQALLTERWLSVIRACAYSLRSGLKTISGSQDIAPVESYISGANIWEILYLCLHYLFAVLAPVMTSGLIISLFGDLSDRFRYRFSFSRKCHIFSSLDAPSLSLAAQIRENAPRDTIVFCNTRNSDETLLAEGKKLYAAFLYSGCDTLRLPLWKKSLEFYLLSDNEDENLRLAEELICLHRSNTRIPITINASAESRSGIQAVESMDKGGIGMRFIDSNALLCNHLLLQEPLYTMAEDEGPCSVMIVGGGKLGLRMLKSVVWCGQSGKRPLKIRLYDRRAAAIEKELEAQCPGLWECCDLGFVDCEVESADFERLVLDEKQGSADACWIFVALAEDERSIATAERLFELFRRQRDYGPTPRILARVRSSLKLDLYSDRENPYLKTRNIRLFGSLAQVFSHNSLFHSQLERLAFAVELCYNSLLPEKDPEDMSEKELEKYFSAEAVAECHGNFMHSEYMRRSSMASALHIPTKLYDCGLIAPGQDFISREVAQSFKKALESDSTLLDSLSYTEHSRWNAYMFSEGYRRAEWEDLLRFYPKLEVKNNQDKLSRSHLCLVDWNSLDSLNEKYMSLVPTPKKKDFKKSDRDIILSIPKIIMLTKRLEETGLDISMYS